MSNLPDYTYEERQILGKIAGYAGAKAKKRNSNMKKELDILLQLTLRGGEAEELDSLMDAKGKNVTVEQGILLAQIQRALKGNTDSAKFIRDTSGNKLADRRTVDDIELEDLSFIESEVFGNED